MIPCIAADSNADLTISTPLDIDCITPPDVIPNSLIASVNAAHTGMNVLVMYPMISSMATMD